MTIIFAQRLRKIMQRRNLNQMALAQQIGVGQSQVSNWLSGKFLPNYLSIKILCEKLQIDVSELFDK
jgi:transcriptional regulator with XRE-family HTH domain